MDKIKPPFQHGGGERMKKKKWRSQIYLDWIRARPCINCDAPPPSDPHHIRRLSFDAGSGTTSHDCSAIPLCRECHTRVDEFRADETDMLAFTLVDAVVEGILIIS